MQRLFGYVKLGGAGYLHAGEGETVEPDVTAPSAPTNFAVTPGDTLNTLTWTDPADVDLAGIRVYRSTTEGSGHTLIDTISPGVETYEDDGLTNGTTYYYVLTAIDEVPNESEETSEESGTPTAPPLALPDTPFAIYDFTEGSGTTVNDSGAGNHDGSTAGSPAWDSTGLILDGTTQQVNFSHSLPAEDLTVIVVATVDAGVAATDPHPLFWASSATTGHKVLTFNGPVTELEWWLNTTGGSTNVFIDDVLPTPGEPFFVAGTYNHPERAVYFNGTQVASTSSAGTPAGTASSSYILGFGFSSERFIGILHYVVIYDRLLTQEEVGQAYAYLQVELANRGVYLGIEPPADIFVATTGNDTTGDGTSGNPYATISQALSVANPGDIIEVADGSYVGAFATTADGASGNPITVRAATRYGATLDGDDNASGYVWENSGDYIIIDGFEITNGRYLGIYNRGANNIIQNCWIHDLTAPDNNGGNGGAFITDHATTSSNNVIRNNFCHGNVVSGGSNQTHGIYVHGDGTQVYNNIVGRVSARCVQVFEDVDNVLVANNLCFNGIHGLIINGDNNTVINNIFVDTVIGIESNKGDASGNVFSNNRYWNVTSQFTTSNGETNANATSGDPGLVAYVSDGTGDYNVAGSGSAVVNAGTATNAPTVDMTGAGRIGGIDQGPLEYGSSFTNPNAA